MEGHSSLEQQLGSQTLPAEPQPELARVRVCGRPQACGEVCLMKMHVHTHRVFAVSHFLVCFSVKCHPVGVCLFTSCVRVVQPAEKNRGWRGSSGSCQAQRGRNLFAERP